MDDDNIESFSAVRRLTKQAEALLFHDRFGHPCMDTIKDIHKHVDDCPKLRCNAFFNCWVCMQEKARHRSFPQVAHQSKLPTASAMPQPAPSSTQDTDPKPTSHPDDATYADPYDEVTAEDADLRPGQVF